MFSTYNNKNETNALNSSFKVCHNIENTTVNYNIQSNKII